VPIRLAAGIHGDESDGILAALTVYPCVNPVGYERKCRENGRAGISIGDSSTIAKSRKPKSLSANCAHRSSSASSAAYALNEWFSGRSANRLRLEATLFCLKFRRKLLYLRIARCNLRFRVRHFHLMLRIKVCDFLLVLLADKPKRIPQGLCASALSNPLTQQGDKTHACSPNPNNENSEWTWPGKE
jgi:hypothetical protein